MLYDDKAFYVFVSDDEYHTKKMYYRSNELNGRLIISYYKKEEVSPSEVLKIISEYSEEDLLRYKEKMKSIVLLSKENYENNLKQQEQIKQNDIDAEEYINEFKVRIRK